MESLLMPIIGNNSTWKFNKPKTNPGLEIHPRQQPSIG